MGHYFLDKLYLYTIFYKIRLAILPPVKSTGLVEEGVENDVAVALVELPVHTLFNLPKKALSE